jgi:hypothetical protein
MSWFANIINFLAIEDLSTHWSNQDKKKKHYYRSKELLLGRITLPYSIIALIKYFKYVFSTMR